MWHDAHLHIKDTRLLQEMIHHDIYGIANADSVSEYERIKQFQTEWNHLSISAGIHPWLVDQVRWEELLPVMEEVKFIGEIGLDNVWCNTSLDLQKQVFDRSLAYASAHHKPVILHIKGMEKEALPFLKRYPNTYLVHWYSCEEYVQEYIALGCLFTIGPSIGKDPAVNQVAKLVPIDRILLETDGIDALSWCDERTVEVSEYVDILKRSNTSIAQFKQRQPEDVLQIMNETYMKFISIAEKSCDN